MKRNLTRSWLVVLTLVMVLGGGFRLRGLQAQTQAAGAASTAQTQSQDKSQQEQEVDENDTYRKSPSVGWLGRKMGIGTDHASSWSELANFALFALGIGWLVVVFLPKAFPALVPSNRTATIQKQLVDARTATEEARARLSGVEERLGKLDGEIAAMRAQAEQDAAKEELRVKASVEEEKKKILASAEQEIAAATMHAQKQLQQHAAELAIEQAARKLVVSAETDRLLVQGFAQRLAGDESKKGQN